MNAVDAGDSDTRDIVGELLLSLVDMDEKLVDAHKRIKARKLGTIDLMEEKEIGILRSEGRRFVGRLAALLGVEVRQDVFAGFGPSYFSGAQGPITPQGNLPPLG